MSTATSTPPDPLHEVTLTYRNADDGVHLVCTCGHDEILAGGDAPTPAEAMLAELAHLGPRRLGIRVNANSKMSRGKAVAQAVHATLMLFGIHHKGAVIVLGGTPAQIEGMDAVVHDAGLTEVERGTTTAGAKWLAPFERMED